MTIIKRCDMCKHFPNDEHCVGCVWDKDKKENTKWELKENPIVIERGVLDEIRAEIDNINLNEVATKYGDRFYGFQREVINIIDKYRESEE